MFTEHSTRLWQCTAPSATELMHGAHLRCLPLRGLCSCLCGLRSGLRRCQGLHALHGWRLRWRANWPRLLLLQLLLGLGLQALLLVWLLLLLLLWLLWLLGSTEGLSRRLSRPRCWRLPWLALHGAAAGDSGALALLSG